MKARSGIIAACTAIVVVSAAIWMIRGGTTGLEPTEANAAVTQSAEGADVPKLPQPAATVTGPLALEAKLGRPIVFYAEGTLGQGFFETLRALDEPIRAFDYEVQPAALTDVDVYLLKAASWDAIRARTNHVLHANMTANLEGRSDTLAFSWFEATLSAKDGSVQRDVMVILANDQGLQSLSRFCTIVSIYDLVRYAHDGGALNTAEGAQVLRTEACRNQGWQSVADLPAGE
ncbi:MAG: hypothetical protein AAFN94_16590 [Pseudomonadota bacterium]